MGTLEAPSGTTANRSFGRETKFQKVRLELELLANRLGPGQKLPPIRELAASLGASINTLSGALEELEKANVVQRQHGKGIFVLPSRPRSVWLLCDSNFFASGHSPFWDALVDQVRVRALVHNEQLSLHFTLPCEDSQSTLHPALVREIEEGRVHGIVGVGLNRDLARWILDQEIAYTAFAGWAPFMIRPHDEEIVRQGVKALVGQGCKHIALWQNVRPDLTGVFEAALRDFGLSMGLGQPTAISPAGTWPTVSQQREPSQQLGYRTALEVFGRPRSEWPDGVIITEDMMTQGVLMAMTSLGIRPGDDIQIVTHANKGITNFLGDPRGIIRVEYDLAEVVQRLFDILEALMKRETPAGVVPVAPNTQIYSIEPQTVFPEQS